MRSSSLQSDKVWPISESRMDSRPRRPDPPCEDAAAQPGNESSASATITTVTPDPSQPDGTPEGPATPPVLREIVEHKREEVRRAKVATPLRELEAMVAQEEPPRNFFRAVTRRSGGTAVIAEIKRRSPSAGLMRPEFDGDGFRPEDIALAYFRNGASAISCLTDEKFFGGHLSYIGRVKEAVPLPVLRKDFLIDTYQLWESRAHGADAVLLIAECLTESQIVDMLILAQQLQLTVLLEVHSMENLLRVRPHVGFPHPAYCLLGINNRDLSSMTVDLTNTLRLVDLVDERSVLVSESGIRTAADIARLREQEVRIVLVGEHLMKQDSPGRALAELLGTTPVEDNSPGPDTPPASSGA